MRLALVCVVLPALGRVLIIPPCSVCETVHRVEFLLELVFLTLFIVFYDAIAKKWTVDTVAIDGAQQVSFTVPLQGRGSAKKPCACRGNVLDSGVSMGSQILKPRMRNIDRAQFQDVTPKASELSELMAGCLKSGRVPEALGLFDHMLDKGTAPDAHRIRKHISDKFFNLVLEHLTVNRLREDGLALIRLIRAHGLHPSVPTQNRLAAAWKSQFPEEVLHYFMKMKSEGVTIARIVYHCIMMAFERSDPELTLTIFEEMEGLGMKPDGVAYNAVLGACCQLGMHERARHLFLQMAERELVPDRKSYSIMVKVCATSNQPEAAVTFMGTMRKRGFEPDRWTYHYAIVSCLALRRTEHATETYNDMLRAKVRPRSDTCRSMRAAIPKFGLTHE